jgi:NDP-sugar pyrophosphorylase family protein
MTHAKEKVAISIDAKLLKQVDALVDGSAVRSRSHAVETLLKKALGGARKALVLAGGEGRGLAPLTYSIPKPLIEVNGKPVLQRIVEWLAGQGISDIIVSVGYLGEQIEAYFGNGSAFGVSIAYVREKEPLGTAGPLLLAANALREPFVMLNGDVLCDFDLRGMLAFHARAGGMATVALKESADASKYGAVLLQGENVTSFVEKARRGAALVNAGVYVMEPGVIALAPQKGSLEKDVFPALARKRLLRGYVFDGRWADVGTPEALKEAEAMFD